NHAKSGDLMTKISGDTNTLKDLFAESILKFASQVLEIIGMFAIMLALNWKVGLIPLATMPFLCFSLFHLYHKTKASVKKQKRQEGELVLVVDYLNNLSKPLRCMAKLSTDLSKAMASADRISEVLDLEPEIQDRPDAVEAARLKGEIIFQNVSFDYGDGKDVLRHIS